MRILHITATVDPASGGPIEGIRLLNECSPTDTREVVSLDPADAPFLSKFNMPIHALGSPKDGQSWLARRYRYSSQLVPWLKSNVTNFDFVIVDGLWNYSTWAAARVLPQLAVPYYVFPHGMLDPWFAKRYPLKHLAKRLSWLLTEGVLLNNACAVLFTTETERRLASRQFIPESYGGRVIGFGTMRPKDDDDYDGEVRTRPWQRRYILFLGRLHEKKGIDLLLEGFSRVAHLAPDCDLLVAGPTDSAYADEMQALSARLGIPGRVHFAGMLTGPDKWRALKNADAFALVSHQENFGVAVAEALSVGCPTLISDKVNIWREIVDGGAGFAAPDDIAGAQSLLSTWFACDEGSRERMRAAALEVFDRHFNMREVAVRLGQMMSEDRRTQPHVDSIPA